MCGFPSPQAAKESLQTFHLMSRYDTNSALVMLDHGFDCQKSAAIMASKARHSTNAAKLGPITPQSSLQRWAGGVLLTLAHTNGHPSSVCPGHGAGPGHAANG